MQDRYAADLGDFLKLGLLRWLVATPPKRSRPRLGVVWYRVPNEEGNADGKYVAYLRDGHPTGRMLQELAPDLYDRLRSVHDSGDRSVAKLESSGVLPAGTQTHSAELAFRHLGPREQGSQDCSPASVVRRGTHGRAGMLAGVH